MANPEHLAKLSEGVEAWNQWRTRNPKANPDLHSANLIEAHLQHAILHSAILQSANLIEAHLQRAHLTGAILNGAKLQGAILHKTTLIEAYLQDVKLQDADLTGAILNGAKLQGADLTGATLNGAKLQDADLTGATLNGAKLQSADLTGATLNGAKLQGACIQDWIINCQTKLDDITCDYIYLSSTWEDKKWKYTERRPHDPDRIFELGEFTKLFQVAAETLDFVFNSCTEWSAFLSVFEQFRQEIKSKDFNIQAIERKLGGSFLIKVAVPAEYSKAEMEKSIYSKYKRLLNLQKQRVQERLKAKDREIAIYKQKYTDIFELVKLSLSRPIAIENKNTMTEAPKYDQRHAQFAGGFAETVGGNQEGGNIHNYAPENKQNLAEAAAEIRQLLDELAQSYPTQTMPEKMVVATKAIEKIESDPNWKQRVVNAAKVGGVQALEKAIDNPFGAFVAGAIEGWQES